jgi:hypothetical protein
MSQHVKWLGTAFLLDDSCTFATAKHLFRKAGKEKIVIRFQHPSDRSKVRTLPVRILYVDDRNDIAFLKLDYVNNKPCTSKDLHMFPLLSRKGTGILTGESVFIIGHPTLAKKEEIDIPVGFHIFPGGPNYGIHLMPKMLSGMRAKNANPLQLEDALIRFPNLRLYIMHGGWPYIDDVKALMYMHPNVYVDIAVLNWLLPQDEFENYIKALITAGFGNRILFGTDQMVWPETIDDAIESVNAAEFLTLEQKEDIFYDNAAEFLRLTDSEIKKHKGK